MQVVSAGALTLAQDLGRGHLLRQGISVSGAADRGAHALGQRLCANAPGAASLENTLGGLCLRALSACVVAVTGADVDLRVDGVGVGSNAAFVLPADAVLSLGQVRRGLRAYVSVRGGFNVTPILGSRSRDTLGGIGPLPFSAGDIVPIGNQNVGQAWFEVVPVPNFEENPTLFLRPGPHDDALDELGWHQLEHTQWTIDPASNRIGVRLNASPLPVGAGELPSFAVLPGCVQLPASGLPIILGPDAGVTGGYPVLGVIGQRDLDRLAQARPGDHLRLRRLHSVPAPRLLRSL